MHDTMPMIRGGLTSVRRFSNTRNMITQTVKLPHDLDARLRRRARELKLSYSEVARQALQEGLRENSGVDMLSALEEFAGVVSGPEDLSTNPEYLADFGKRRDSR